MEEMKKDFPKSIKELGEKGLVKELLLDNLWGYLKHLWKDYKENREESELWKNTELKLYTHNGNDKKTLRGGVLFPKTFILSEEKNIKIKKETNEIMGQTDILFSLIDEKNNKQIGYIYGYILTRHPDPYAVMDILYVKKGFRNRGYGKELIKRFIKENDDYEIWAKVNANEKPEDFVWKIKGGGYSKSRGKHYQMKKPFSIEEFNKRQKRLVAIYKQFGFKIDEERKDSEGRKYYLLKRSN
jgi:ribosomal protein S18 acetylase RimI-like enzyme